MASSVFESAQKDAKSKVSVLTKKDITKHIPPPYDLIKCDIEGSGGISSIISPKLSGLQIHTIRMAQLAQRGRRIRTIEDSLKNLDYEIVKSSNATDAIGIDGKVGLFLAKNLRTTT